MSRAILLRRRGLSGGSRIPTGALAPRTPPARWNRPEGPREIRVTAAFRGPSLFVGELHRSRPRCSDGVCRGRVSGKMGVEFKSGRRPPDMPGGGGA